MPWTTIADARNSEPEVTEWRPVEPEPFLHSGADVCLPDADDLDACAGLLNVAGVQPYKLVMVGEKSSLRPVLSPVAQEHGADLYLPTGEISDTLIYRMAQVGAEDGRPLVVTYFADADPAGHQMRFSHQDSQATDGQGRHPCRSAP